MAESAATRAVAERLVACFEALGARRVEAGILQPAGPLLDLYGEDIRARAFITTDPLSGEAMLRPDFTVPVVQRHLEGGGGEARYTYAGEVFRKQEEDTGRPSEYIQVGYEHIGGPDRARADADMFAAFHELLAPLGVKPATGDIGILIAAVQGLDTTQARKSALLRHLWRPRRFRALIDRFRAPPETRSRVAKSGSPTIGRRTRGDVDTRLAALAEDAAAPPLSADQAEMLDGLLRLNGGAASVLSQLHRLSSEFREILSAVENFGKRLDALSGAGLDVDELPFETSYGRTTLEYYDGFVFGFYIEDRPDLPPVA
ncbi:MAG: ATP phosphoribosyltransferase regulatory subunit, partial [Pseudomonadota bacterium]